MVSNADAGGSKPDTKDDLIEKGNEMIGADMTKAGGIKMVGKDMTEWFEDSTFAVRYCCIVISSFCKLDRINFFCISCSAFA